MTDDKRHEVLLVGDVFGLEPLADEITYTLAADGSTIPTVLGLFGGKMHPSATWEIP